MHTETGHIGTIRGSEPDSEKVSELRAKLAKHGEELQEFDSEAEMLRAGYKRLESMDQALNYTGMNRHERRKKASQNRKAK